MDHKLIDLVEQDNLKKEVPEFEIGDTVDVHTKILEGDKERIQVFTGTVIARAGAGMRETFTVRRIVAGEGVEEIHVLQYKVAIGTHPAGGDEHTIGASRHGHRCHQGAPASGVADVGKDGIGDAPRAEDAMLWRGDGDSEQGVQVGRPADAFGDDPGLAHRDRLEPLGLVREQDGGLLGTQQSGNLVE